VVESGAEGCRNSMPLGFSKSQLAQRIGLPPASPREWPQGLLGQQCRDGLSISDAGDACQEKSCMDSSPGKRRRQRSSWAATHTHRIPWITAEPWIAMRQLTVVGSRTIVASRAPRCFVQGMYSWEDITRFFGRSSTPEARPRVAARAAGAIVEPWRVRQSISLTGALSRPGMRIWRRNDG
jgi:hypothetical protein